MKIGYPCINNRIGCTSNSTFRLASYSRKKLFEKVEKNLECLNKMIDFNIKNNLMFLRIGSGLVPFASHPRCRANWQDKFKDEFKEIGKKIKKNKMRISVHPGQYTVLNSPSVIVIRNTLKELEYHNDILDLMKLDGTAKIQIHVGGVYHNKLKAIERFMLMYRGLDRKIKKRIVIENDHSCYDLKDCMYLYKKVKVPVIFDTFHHQVKNNGETFREAMKMDSKTWKKTDGIPMIDYSTGSMKTKKHSKSINIKKFKDFLKETKGMDFDIMLEIKDKEKSALKAVKFIRKR